MIVFSRIWDATEWASGVHGFDGVLNRLRDPRLSPDGSTQALPLYSLSTSDQEQYVNTVCERRHVALQQLQSHARAVSMSSCDARFLLYHPGETMNDGIAASESDGFFDEHNCPPWGSWIVYVSESLLWRAGIRRPVGYLISRVPLECVVQASRGVESNAEGCITWLDDEELGFNSVASALKTLIGHK